MRSAAETLAAMLGLSSPDEVFPWQLALLKRFLEGDIPSALDIPTGLGKSAVMPVWLVARAYGAAVPRRLVYTVDRRAVVDYATDLAVGLREFVERDEELRSRLNLGRGTSLAISTLRGQYVDNREWLRDPAAPAVVVGTVDMVGSRLLFQGYGVSPKMRPYVAGLLGVDTLFVIDEAHLVPPFEHLLRSIERDAPFSSRDYRYREHVPPLRVLALSATGRGLGGDVVGLTENDLVHDVLRRRLWARKSISLVPVDSETTIEGALAQLAWELARAGKNPVRVLIYSDSREVARRAKEAVEKLAKRNRRDGTAGTVIDTELLVGGRRIFERESAKERLINLGFIAGRKFERSVPSFLFATSAGEVGVDLDADHMVCDLVSWERMVQRFGRVNRRGDGEAQVVVLVEAAPDTRTLASLEKAERGGELGVKEKELVERWHRNKTVRRLIEALPKNASGGYDGSPGALWQLKMRAAADDSLRQLLRDAITPEPLRPALTRPLVDAWAMTSLEKHTGRPEIQPWLRGWITAAPPQTAVVWRTHLPVRAGGQMPSKKEVEAFFEAAPVRMSEILETETFVVVKWIMQRCQIVRLATDNDGTSDVRLHDEDVVAFALEPDLGLRRAFRLEELCATENKEQLQDILEGATLVVDARLRGLTAGLLDASATSVPRTADDGQDWLGEGVVGFRVRCVEASTTIPRLPNWRERFRFVSAATEEGEATRFLVVEKWWNDVAVAEDASTGTPQLLDEHQAWTEACARHLATRLGLDERLVRVLTLAARLHDEGKRAARWQRAFRAPKFGVYAKTQGPIEYALLDGYRHELGSVLRVEHDQRVRILSEEDRDLVLHLIAAHHGLARPVIGTRACEDAPPSTLAKKTAEIALRFARLHDQWAPWGLAWLEALLRAADQQASCDNDTRAWREADEPALA